MKNIIWLSPSLAAGAIAARLVVFFKTAPEMRRGGPKLTAPPTDIKGAFCRVAGRNALHAA